ncbi:MAG: 16S rRNA (guanine(966)-N(2))-methyltransferase RsmD [Deltaproteobacteria bacterium]|nr:MAG: 16S rRNA (guanine(966)-N(2))-methyltransferase RsmD [Deltaproteobacteria bacterium]
MRIIAGKHRGLRLASPKGKRLRPTAERVREAIFSMVGLDLSGLWVLDLFAGTGAMGLEAFSRGAAFVVLVDYHLAASRLISRNLATLGNPQHVRLYRQDLRRGLKWLTRQGWHFDLVFLDPPYGSDLSQRCLTQLGSGALLNLSATVISEHDLDETLALTYGCLQRQTTRRYGNTAVSCYRREN